MRKSKQLILERMVSAAPPERMKKPLGQAEAKRTEPGACGHSRKRKREASNESRPASPMHMDAHARTFPAQWAHTGTTLCLWNLVDK